MADLRVQDSFEMNVMIPSFLKRGDTIGIVATARWISPEHLKSATDLIEAWGFQYRLASNLHAEHFQLAGTKQERLTEMQRFLDDADLKAIIVARGGYGTVHLMDELDFTQFMLHPKWICGYSDITVLHAHLNSAGIATIHSTMPVSFKDATVEALENMRLALTGELREIRFVSNNRSDFSNVEFDGLPLFGGNLSVIYSLLGSESLQPNFPFIFFLEDVDEMYYHVDRMMTALQRSGFLKNVKAVIVGGLTQMKDNTKEFGFQTDNPWGSSALEAISKVLNEAGIPVFSDFPAGHLNDNRAFYLGVKCGFRCENSSAVLHFQQA